MRIIVIPNSKFCDLRPQCIKLFEHIPHQVCVCHYHENIRLLLTGYTQLSVDFHSFIDQVTCNSSEKKCMKSNVLHARIKLINMPLAT